MSTNRRDGGAAFPSEVASQMPADQREGMSLRDYFAAKAMQGLCRTLADSGSEPHYATCAIRSYAMADAMLAERAKKEAGR